MCGITGIYSPGTKIERSVLTAMTETLRHRGPDDSGVHIDADGGLGLGHTRLSIIDLSPKGRQPMSNDAGNITASYNGEIYNYREIRDELAKKGHRFTSESDTEVVVKAYQEWGMGCLGRFIGMFALAIWDASSETLFLARDRAGVKPLYYHEKNGLFLFASELKAIMKHPKFTKRISGRGLSLFLRYGYIRSPHTIFENTFKLEPGHYMSVRKGEIKKHRYWNIADFYNAPPHDGSEEEISGELEKILVDSFKYRLVSDVPVGLFLSGGVDSSIVAALLQKTVSTPIKSFTIGFTEKKYNEARQAKKIASYIGTDHTEHYMSEDEALEIVAELPSIYDEPLADNSVIPTCTVSKMARRQVKVALSADGGDELFCGYNRYVSYANMVSAFEKLPRFLRDAAGAGLSVLTPERFGSAANFTGIGRLRALKRKYARRRGILLCIKSNRMAEMFRHVHGRWEPKEISHILGGGAEFEDDTFSEQFREVRGNEVLIRMLAADFGVWLPDDVLTKVDRAAMSVGLESREPLLDHRLMEFAARIPAEYKYRNGNTKYILKKILAKHLPTELFDRKKMGFGAPINSWLRGKLLPLAEDHLSGDAIKRDGIFNPDAVSDCMDMFRKRELGGKMVWNLLVFQMWREKWL